MADLEAYLRWREPAAALEITRIPQGYRYRLLPASGRADAGPRANVTAYTNEVRASALNEVRSNLSDSAHFARSGEDLRGLGRLLYNLLIRPVPTVDHFLRDAHGPLFILTDEPELPFELLHDGETFLGLRLAMGRGILWDQGTRAPSSPGRQGPLSMLIVADAGDDLPGARAEAHAIAQALPDSVNFKLLQGREANLVSVLRELAEGNYDLVHYAGHINIEQAAEADASERRAYLELRRGSANAGGPKNRPVRIMADEIVNMLAGQPLVYLNGCRSGSRVQGAVGRYAENMARAFLRAGALGLVGTLWDVPDEGTGAISAHFYRELLSGQPAAEALRRARVAVLEANPADAAWAAPIFFGDPAMRLRDAKLGGMEDAMSHVFSEALGVPLDANTVKILEQAAHEAQKAGHAVIGSAHLFIAFSRDPDGLLNRALRGLGFSAEGLRTLLRQAMQAERSAGPDRLRFSPSVQDAAHGAHELAAREGASTVSPRHLLIAFLMLAQGSILRLLARIGLEPTALLAALEGNPANLAPLTPARNAAAQNADPKNDPKADIPRRAAPVTLLEQHGRDLTELARQGKLPPLIGRKRELEQIVNILTRETRNNPLLVGEAGVGKTAVVEGLAGLIAEKRVPPLLRSKRLIEVSLTSLLAGTRFRGDFESRIQGLMDEIRADPNVLIFIDEIHGLVGAGDSSGGMDAANMLKPALARGELRCIGATTPTEYGRSIAQDSALERRFQRVEIDEPTADETLHILKALSGRYAQRYGVRILPEALEAAVNLSVRYLADRFLPDKAQAVLEEACTRAATGTMSRWAAPNEEDPLAALPLVDVEAIRAVIAQGRNIPIGRITAGEGEQLLHLEDRLKARVVGQDAAIAEVAKAVRMARTGLKAPNHPVGVFLFVGPSGVGKTELAKALACELFGDENALLRFDMSEYMEQHSVARLIGAQPGYVGYGRDGTLVYALRRQPYSVVLLDEIEKAHSAIFDVFLALFDEGRLTDVNGRRVDGSHAIFIMTSNIGSDVLARGRLGFSSMPAEADTAEVHARLRQVFRPELLNRIDAVLLFNRLLPEHLRAIAEIGVRALQARLLSEQHLQLEVAPEVIDRLAQGDEHGPDTSGARAIGRAITALLVVPLSELILRGARGTIRAWWANDAVHFETG